MNDEIQTRQLSADQAKQLDPGAAHYTAYVGPPAQYDFMGATQFRLLTTLGLRSHHKVLDFGCGSLRAGRFLIMYLDAGGYFGQEPNRWLIDDAIEHEVGSDLVRLKRPTFGYSDDFRVESFGEQFDFIVAQSVFSHAGPDLVATALESFCRTLAAPQTDVLAREIDAFSGDYEMMIGTIEMTRPGGPMPVPALISHRSRTCCARDWSGSWSYAGSQGQSTDQMTAVAFMGPYLRSP